MADDLRRAPTAAVFASHLPREVGKCDWCGLPCEERTEVRKHLKRRHAACEAEFQICVSPEYARKAVFERDKGICSICGEDWSEEFYFRAGASCIAIFEGTAHERHLGYYRSTEVIWVSRWHVDHKIPLFRVRHMPPLQRIEYFKLHNLVTACDECHEVKCAQEALERAHARNVNGENRERPKTKWAKRPMRGFERRPARDINDE